MVRKLLLQMLVAAVLTAAPAHALTPAEYDQQVLDAAEFKPRLFRLLESYDRRKTTVADIEATMEVTFAANPAADLFAIDPTPGIRTAPGFRSLNGTQYVLPLSEFAGAGTPAVLKDAQVYGFEMLSLAGTGDACLTLAEVKAHLPGVAKWRFTSLGMFYVGVRGERAGAMVTAFVPKPFPMTKEDAAELDRLTERERPLSGKKLERLEELKAGFDGCVHIFNMY